MIFTDVVMPGGMTGDELAEAALAAKPDLEVTAEVRKLRGFLEADHVKPRALS